MGCAGPVRHPPGAGLLGQPVAVHLEAALAWRGGISVALCAVLFRRRAA